MIGLTDKQRITLTAVIANPRSTIVELGEIMDLKPITVHKRLVGLRDKEYIQLTGKARSIKILRWE